MWSGKGKICGKKKKKRKLKTKVSPEEGRGTESGDLCSKTLTLDPTPEHRPLVTTTQGKKASWTTSVLLPC